MNNSQGFLWGWIYKGTVLSLLSWLLVYLCALLCCNLWTRKKEMMTKQQRKKGKGEKQRKKKENSSWICFTNCTTAVTPAPQPLSTHLSTHAQDFCYLSCIVTALYLGPIESCSAAASLWSWRRCGHQPLAEHDSRPAAPSPPRRSWRAGGSSPAPCRPASAPGSTGSSCPRHLVGQLFWDLNILSSNAFTSVEGIMTLWGS